MSLMLRSRWIGLHSLYAWNQSWASIRPNNHWSNVHLYYRLLWRRWTWNLCSLSSKLWCLFWLFKKVCCMCWWHLPISRSILWRLLPSSLCWRSRQLDLCLLDWGSSIQSWMSINTVQRHKFRVVYSYSYRFLWDIQSNHRLMYIMCFKLLSLWRTLLCRIVFNNWWYSTWHLRKSIWNLW